MNVRKWRKTLTRIYHSSKYVEAETAAAVITSLLDFKAIKVIKHNTDRFTLHLEKHLVALLHLKSCARAFWVETLRFEGVVRLICWLRQLSVAFNTTTRLQQLFPCLHEWTLSNTPTAVWTGSTFLLLKWISSQTADEQRSSWLKVKVVIRLHNYVTRVLYSIELLELEKQLSFLLQPRGETKL